jgi:tRNA-modifying protein YgfZ
MDSFITKLSQFGVIEIKGEDAADFLQAQLTSDVLQLKQRQWQFSAWCNPQGRIIANFICLRFGNGFVLLLAADLVATVCRRLGMYVLRSRVTILNRSDDITCYGLSGEAVSLFKKLFASDGNYMQVDLPDRANPRTIILETAAPTPSLMELLPSDLSRVNNVINWQLMDIRAGNAWITDKISELIIPQELALDKVNGLSLEKGCFPGQEIIARLHYRGKVKYGIYLGECVIPEYIPDEGAKLYTTQKRESCGTIINILKDGNSHLLILAIINHQHASLHKYYLENDHALNINFTAATQQAPSAN